MTVLECEQGTTQKTIRYLLSIKNILFATDFSVASEAALPYVGAIARHFGSTVHITHVISETSLMMMTGGIDYVSVGTLCDDLHAEAQARLQAVASKLGTVTCRTYARQGLVWQTLSEIIFQNAIDLIIVGTHGRTGLGKLVLGSVAEDILRHAQCPVLTVGPEVRGRARLPGFAAAKREIAPVELEVQQILCAINLTPASHTVAPVAAALAEEFDAQLRLLHVIEEYSRPEDRPAAVESGNHHLQALVPPNVKLVYAPETIVEFGAAWECIVKTADEKQADLIVLGAHPSEGTSHVPWSTVHRVVAHANCPVLTVRA